MCISSPPPAPKPPKPLPPPPPPLKAPAPASTARSADKTRKPRGVASLRNPLLIGTPGTNNTGVNLPQR